jgi:hypothetical protein
VATPFDRFWVASLVVPSRNVTVPVGVPVAGGAGVTVAVNVTGFPTAAGLWDDTSATDVGFRTTWVRAVDVIGSKLLSPEYTAVMLWLPAVRGDVV